MTERTRKKRGTLLAVSLAGLFITGLAGVALLLWAPDAPQRQKLAGGVTVSLAGWSYGKHHRLLRGSTPAKRLYDLAPAYLKRYLGCDTVEWDTPEDDLLVWLEVDRKSPLVEQAHPVFVEEDGRESLGDIPRSTFDASGAHPVYGWVITAFPRRQPVLHVRMYAGEADHSRRLAEFTIRNPRYERYPNWKAESLPASRGAGDLNCTVTELVTGLGGYSADHAMHPGEQPDSRLGYDITRAGQPAPEWEAVHVRISDPTGNEWQPFTDSLLPTGRGRQLALWNTTWNEPVWNLRLELARKSEFAPDELWTLRDLPLFGRYRNYLPKDSSTQRFGATLRLRRLGGSGALDPDGSPNPIFDTPSAYFRVNPPDAGVRIEFVAATDDQGRAVGGERMREGQPGEFFVGLHPQKGARKINLTVAVQKSRFVEFRMQPRDARAGPAGRP